MFCKICNVKSLDPHSVLLVLLVVCLFVQRHCGFEASDGSGPGSNTAVTLFPTDNISVLKCSWAWAVTFTQPCVPQSGGSLQESMKLMRSNMKCICVDTVFREDQLISVCFVHASQCTTFTVYFLMYLLDTLLHTNASVRTKYNSITLVKSKWMINSKLSCLSEVQMI